MPLTTRHSTRPPWLTGCLSLILFCSGACALAYQTVWLREFRLIFGGAAPAAAAVLAVFMGGLGVGGWFFGRLVERSTRPFRFYVRLEIAIAVAAMATPWLLSQARAMYLATGGVRTLGGTDATLLQIALTLVVLGPACFLMGGTLPAAIKFAQRDDDPRRSTTAWFYAVNVAGAVAGAAISTFWLLGTAGNKGTLTMAGLLNALLAGGAWVVSQACEVRERSTLQMPEIPESNGRAMTARLAPSSFVLTAAFCSGFTFFVTEMLWYRLSAPLLGGSVYSLGLVLCVALAGMGAGSLCYATLLRRRAPSIEGFGLASALQAFTLILPAVAGDFFAYGALVTNYLTSGFGFGPMVAGWTAIVMALAFLPSFIAGVQFPLLVSLLGYGNAGVGRQLGRAYLCNTAGAILGSLLGGFVLVPALGLRTCWYAVAALTAVMSLGSLLVAPGWKGRSRTKQGATALTAGIIITGTLAVLLTTGPTSVWFHYPIGYGRTLALPNTPEKLEDWMRSVRRSHVQSFDGLETSVAVMDDDEYTLLTNGKADGSALGDSATQVMLGLTGAALHPQVKQACVVGLGTGTTVGWLADVPGVQHVDVIEIEPRMQDLARHFGPVNRGAMDNPKVTQLTGDAREYLAAKGGPQYDLVVSEPSNPYRAGVASLYTREFYHSVRQHLSAEGMLCQWVQGYEARHDTINLVIATLASEFPKVEIWNTMHNDLLLVASNSTAPWNTARLRQRLSQEPFANALHRLWFTDSAEGFLSHCLANQDYTRALAAAETTLNSDDLNLLEFGFASTIGRRLDENTSLYREHALALGQMLPKTAGPPLDEELLGRELLSCQWTCTRKVGVLPASKDKPLPPAVETMRRAFAALVGKQTPVFDQLCAEAGVRTLEERWLQAANHAVRGEPDARTLLTALEPVFPENVALLRMEEAYQRQDYPAARRALMSACSKLRGSIWVEHNILLTALGLAEPLSSSQTRATPEDAMALYRALRDPFLAGVGRDARLTALAAVSGHVDNTTRLDMIDAWGPHFPWRGLPLALRAATYMNANDPRQTSAMEDLQSFVDGGGELPKPKTASSPIAAAPSKTTASNP